MDIYELMKQVNEWVKEILLKEMESARNSSLESIALKICFWGNRIAHHLDNELSAGQGQQGAGDGICRAGCYSRCAA